MSLAAMKPHYAHDCPHCVYLASVRTSKGVSDGYIHTGNGASVILRLSSEPSDYESWPVSLLQNFGELPSLDQDGYAIDCTLLVMHWLVAKAKAAGHI